MIFSIGVKTHFCMYYSPNEGRTYRIDIDALDDINRIVEGVSRDVKITFVSRYDTDEEFRRERGPDVTVESFREQYRQRARRVKSRCLCQHC